MPPTHDISTAPTCLACGGIEPERMGTPQQWFDAYGESHRNHTNKLIHRVCEPLIFFSTSGLLAGIPSEPLKALFPGQVRPFVHYGTVVVLLGLLFYLRLSTVGVVEAAFAAPLWLTCLSVFVLAWIGQFYGHKVEGKKPSFLRGLQFLLIGPAWLSGFICRKLGIPY